MADSDTAMLDCTCRASVPSASEPGSNSMIVKVNEAAKRCPKSCSSHLLIPRIEDREQASGNAPEVRPALAGQLGGDCPTSPAQVSTCTGYLRGVVVASHGRTGAGTKWPGRWTARPQDGTTQVDGNWKWPAGQLPIPFTSGRDPRLKTRLSQPDRFHHNTSPARCRQPSRLSMTRAASIVVGG